MLVIQRTSSIIEELYANYVIMQRCANTVDDASKPVNHVCETRMQKAVTRGQGKSNEFSKINSI